LSFSFLAGRRSSELNTEVPNGVYLEASKDSA
jgi:hypothetical protein